MDTSTIPPNMKRALIAYYRDLAARANETREALPQLSQSMSIRVTLGVSGTELVNCPLDAPQDSEFAAVVLTGIENFCFRQVHQLENELAGTGS